MTRDTNGVRDVFVRDLISRTTVRASVSSSGRQGLAESREPSLSHTGTRVAFSSSSSNLVSKDTNGRADVFVRSLSSGNTIRVSIPPGAQANASSGGAVLSSDGYRAGLPVRGLEPGFERSQQPQRHLHGRLGCPHLQPCPRRSVYATAVQASKRSAPYGARAVVVVGGSDWRSAIAGSSLAGTVRGPILYVSKYTLPAVTRDEIVRPKANRCICRRRHRGGLERSSLSPCRHRWYLGCGARRLGRRVFGRQRRRVARHESQGQGLERDGARGQRRELQGLDRWCSARRGYRATDRLREPVDASLPAAVWREVRDHRWRNGLGAPVGRDESRRRLGRSRVSRLSGANRYLTASAVAKKSVSLRHTWEGVTVVNIARPTEAICGAVMAGRIGTIVLYSTRTRLPTATRARLAASRYRIDSVHVIGTTSSIDSRVLSAIKKALGG